MKKIYSTLAVAAIGAASALAVQPQSEVEMQVFKITDGVAPSQEVINRHLKNHMPVVKGPIGMQVEFAKETTGEAFAKKANSLAAVRKVKKANEKVDLAGNYVNFYLPYFSNYISGKEISQGVVVTVDEENNVTFDGLCGTGVVSGSYNKNYANNVNLQGTYDPETKKITCPGGQVVTVTSGKNLIISPADLSIGKFTSGGDLVFTVSEDGTIVCTTDLYMHPVNESGGYAAQISPVLQPATGIISYTSSLSGAIERPFWYNFTKNDAGKDVVLMSGLNTYQAAGYTTEWVVSEDGKTATVSGDSIAWSNKNSTQDLKFYVSTLSGNNVTFGCTADISDKSKIVFPASGEEWSLYTPDDYWTGRNSQAVITPVSAVEPPAQTGYTVEDVVGDYAVSYYVQLQGGGPYSSEMIVKADTVANGLEFLFPFKNSGNTLTWSLKGTLDPETGDITFLKDQPSGFNGATVSFEQWCDSTYVPVDKIVANYNGKAVVFDPDDGMGLQAASGGYYTFFDTIIMEKIIDDPSADPNEGWTSLGEALFEDAWVVPSYNASLNLAKSWKVELQQSDVDKNVYRLVDPYLVDACPIKPYNESTAKHGYIEFNVSNPDYVYFNVVEAGYANSDQGVTKFYPYNSLTFYMNYLSFDAETTIAIFGEETNTTFKENIVRLGTYESVNSETGETKTIYDACFGIQGDINAGYSWKNSVMTGYIAFPGADPSGVEGIVDSENAPKVYYNLQGIRVANPENGKVYIVRQGNKSDKVLVK